MEKLQKQSLYRRPSVAPSPCHYVQSPHPLGRLELLPPAGPGELGGHKVSVSARCCIVHELLEEFCDLREGARGWRSGSLTDMVGAAGPTSWKLGGRESSREERGIKV